MRRSLIVEDILLIEPAYKNKYPPIGLMKIAYFHRYIMHDYVRFAKGRLPEGLENKKWDRVYVTTLFTICAVCSKTRRKGFYGRYPGNTAAGVDCKGISYCNK